LRFKYAHWFGNQQHASPLPVHPQSGGPPVRSEFSMAAAHPTPGRTLIAPNRQFNAQAPHSMQLSRSSGTAFPFCNTNTPRAHTSMHLPQPVHLSEK